MKMGILETSAAVSCLFLHKTQEYLITLKGKVKISLLQAVEALRVARGRGSHVT
jgi:hypothetical protein